MKPLPLGTKRITNGYVEIKVTEGRGRKNWVREHRVVWMLHNGPLPDGAVVHHRNEIKTDNRIENLIAEPSNSAHMKHHHDAQVERGRAVGRLGRGMPKSPEHRAKIAAALRGKTKTPEHRAKLADGVRRYYAPKT